MTLENFKKLSPQMQQSLVDGGGRFLVFTYCYSYVVSTHRKPSKVFFVSANEPAIFSGFPYLLISLVCGWWGVPWGPIYTIQAIFNAFSGVDFTESACHDLGLRMPGSTAPSHFAAKNVQETAQVNNAPQASPSQDNASFCPQCGNKLSDQSGHFCPRCGAKLC